MAQVRRDIQGRRKVETFPRACVHAMRDGVQLALGITRQVCALGQVLAQAAMGVLVGAALPGAYGSAKKIWLASRWAKRSCSAISFPRS